MKTAGLGEDPAQSTDDATGDLIRPKQTRPASIAINEHIDEVHLRGPEAALILINVWTDMDDECVGQNNGMSDALWPQRSWHLRQYLQ